MAMAAKQLVCLLILAILGLSMVATEVMAGGNYGPGSLKGYQCGSQCTRRCSRTQYRKPCLFFCNKCCAKCLCVPPGFYGNKAVCPCYNNWKTQQGGPKCP
ncbi:Gibberellin-regulated protein 6 [Linum grandiflorum]